MGNCPDGEFYWCGIVMMGGGGNFPNGELSWCQVGSCPEGELY